MSHDLSVRTHLSNLCMINVKFETESVRTLSTFDMVVHIPEIK